ILQDQRHDVTGRNRHAIQCRRFERYGCAVEDVWSRWKCLRSAAPGETADVIYRSGRLAGIVRIGSIEAAHWSRRRIRLSRASASRRDLKIRVTRNELI